MQALPLASIWAWLLLAAEGFLACPLLQGLPGAAALCGRVLARGAGRAGGRP